MRLPQYMTDSVLAFIAEDCFAAVGANPEGVKAEEYLTLGRACRAEQHRRQDTRQCRAVLRYGPVDLLTLPRRVRATMQAHDRDRRRAWAAAHSLGWYRVHGGRA